MNSRIVVFIERNVIHDDYYSYINLLDGFSGQPVTIQFCKSTNKARLNLYGYWSTVKSVSFTEIEVNGKLYPLLDWEEEND